MFFPGVGIDINPLWLIVLGFTLGTCTGFFGIGGGFMVTPGFNMLGMPMPYAIGTDLFQMAGKSVISTLKHGKLGNVDIRLGLIMVVGTMAGVEAGKQIVMYLEGVGNVDTVVRYIYIAFLGGLGLFMLREARKSLKTRSDITDSRDVVRSRLVQRLQAVNIPPFMAFPTSGITRVSIWVPIGIGFATGILAGLLGVGGGFIRMPALIYLMGVPTVVAVGTDLFEIIISGSYGAFTYGLEGRVDIQAAAITLVAAAAGVQVGVVATKYVRGDALRQYFAWVILLAGISVALKQAGSVANLTYLNDIGTYLLFGSAGGIAILICLLTLAGYRRVKMASQHVIPDVERPYERGD